MLFRIPIAVIRLRNVRIRVAFTRYGVGWAIESLSGISRLTGVFSWVLMRLSDETGGRLVP